MGKNRGSSSTLLRILHSPPGTEECFDSPTTDVPNEDGCVKTRQVDVNRAQTEFPFYHARRSAAILKRALISRLSQNKIQHRDKHNFDG